MSITPVSVALKGVNYNNVNFEARKKNNNGGEERAGHNSSSIKTKLMIPLAATVLAMSPNATSAKDNRISEINRDNIEELINSPRSVNSLNQEGGNTIVSSKIFSGVGGEFRVETINTGNPDKTKFQKVIINDNTYGVKSTIELDQIIQYEYAIFFNDNSKGIDFHSKRLNGHRINEKRKALEGKTAHYYNDEIYDYLNKLSKTPNNEHAFENLIGFALLTPSAEMNLQNVGKPAVWADAKPKADYGTKILTEEIQGDKGKYQVTFYDKDGNNESGEVFTIKKDGCPELQVVRAGISEHTFGDVLFKPQRLKISMVVMQGAGPEPIVINDDRLTEILTIFSKKIGKNLKDAYEIVAPDFEYFITYDHELISKVREPHFW